MDDRNRKGPCCQRRSRRSRIFRDVTRRALQTPIALSFEGRETSYRALDELSNQVANGLVAVRRATGEPYCDPRQEFGYRFSGLLGAAKVRAVLVPSMQGWHLPRSLFAVNDAQTGFSLSAKRSRNHLPQSEDQLDADSPNKRRADLVT